MSEPTIPDNRTEARHCDHRAVSAYVPPADLVLEEIRSMRLAWTLCEAGKLHINHAADAKHLWNLFDKRIGAPPDIGEVKDEQQARRALRVMEAALAALLAGDDSTSSEPPADATATLPKRLTVSMECRTVVLDGQTYDVDSALALRWLKVLSDHPGEWIAGTELSRFDSELDGAHTDRLKKLLPAPVQSLIDSKPGKGSRLRMA